MNDLIDYIGWQFWDMLGMRATEGESGLIPRQEYEAVALIQEVVRYGELLQAVTDAVSAEGVLAMGEAARNEIGSKQNVIHEYLLGSAPLIGRGIFIKAGGATREIPGEEHRRFPWRAFSGGIVRWFSLLPVEYRARCFNEWVERSTMPPSRSRAASQRAFRQPTRQPSCWPFSRTRLPTRLADSGPPTSAAASYFRTGSLSRRRRIRLV
jgi:hypothetical protein